MTQAAPRRTKIVCTLGPATNEPATIGALIDAGMDAARVNLSHAAQEEAARLIQTVREEAARRARHVAVLLDLQGPKIRTGPLADGQPVALHQGSRVTITTRPVAGTPELISTDYPALPQEVRPGDRILLADGLIELSVVAAGETEVETRVVHGGLLAPRQGITLPGVAVHAPALTEKDRSDLAFGVRAGVDYVALSFVRRPEDVVEAKRLVAELGADTPVIAKIEKAQALEHLEEILRVADGVMVARGDMGVELPPEQVPVRQKEIIGAAAAAQVPAITATQMLESMVRNPRPTRAEASDVAHAIWDGTDALMLSGETAIGRYPLEAVRIMDRIAREAERHAAYFPPRPAAHRHPSFTHDIGAAARQIATENRDVRAIAAFTRTGTTARLISKDRPPVPVLGFTASPAAAARMALYWGVTPVLHPEEVATVGGMFDAAERAAEHLPFLAPGDPLVVVGRIRLDTAGVTNFLTLHRIGAPRPQA
ncbi:MAG TPA: pyruvate kinase [Dehalococcoidia bacterium]